MELDKIYNILHMIVQKFFPNTLISEEDWMKFKSLPLTGNYWDFDANDMVYLFFEVEKAFDIHILPKDIVKYKFVSIDQIATIIGSYLSADITYARKE